MTTQHSATTLAAIVTSHQLFASSCLAVFSTLQLAVKPDGDAPDFPAQLADTNDRMTAATTEGSRMRLEWDFFCSSMTDAHGKFRLVADSSDAAEQNSARLLALTSGKHSFVRFNDYVNESLRRSLLH